MTPARLLGLTLLVLGALPMAGCAALRSINSAASSLDTYELSAPEPSPGAATTGRRVLQVGVPTASGAIATDRIMIRPGPLQVAYLQDGRWVDQAPVHVQQLLIQSLASAGRFGFVGGESTGPLPDFMLLGDLQAFQAEVVAGGPAPVSVEVRLTLTLLRDIDRSVIAARTFEASVPAASAAAPAVVTAFDLAMRDVLAEATRWTVAAASGAGA